VNLLLFEEDEIDSRGRVRLRERRADHLRHVLRVRPNTTLRIGVVRGPTGTATVTRVADESVDLEVRLTGEPPPPPDIELILAVPRPKALPRVVQHAAALGTRRIDLVNAWRVEKAYFDSPRLDPDALRYQAWLGCEQGAITWVPEINVHRRLLPFLSQVLGPRLRDAAPPRRLLAHPEAVRFVEEVSTDSFSSVTVVAIGPEGGWIGEELESLVELGFVSVRLGRGLLRTEAAVTSLLAQVELCTRVSGRTRSRGCSSAPGSRIVMS